MTFKDIKNISDEEFINIFKKYIPKEVVDEIYNGKLTRYNKKAYIASIITLGSVLGIISINTLEEVLKEAISLELTSGMLMGSILLSYSLISSLRKKEFNIRKDKFNEDLLDIKKDICNLSKEEFNILISSYEYIANNKLDSNINLNVLEVIDKLLSINATRILKEFEIENSSSDILVCYEDKKDNIEKTKTKGN